MFKIRCEKLKKDDKYVHCIGWPDEIAVEPKIGMKIRCRCGWLIVKDGHILRIVDIIHCQGYILLKLDAWSGDSEPEPEAELEDNSGARKLDLS